MTLGFRSILVVNSEKMAICFESVNFFRYASFTGKIENLAETPILKDFFIFVANGHHFQKCQFFNLVVTLRQSDKCFCQYQFWCKYVNFVQKKLKFWEKC